MSILEQELKVKAERYENCDYFFYQVDADNKPLLLDEKSLEEIYQLLMTFSFPMNTLPQHRDAIAKLRDEEQNLMDNHEYEFLRRQLAKINKSFRMIAVPKTFYQVFYLMKQFEAAVVPQADPNAQVHFVKPFEPSLQSLEPDERNIYRYTFNYLQNAGVKNCWKKINNDFIRHLLPKALPVKLQEKLKHYLQKAKSYFSKDTQPRKDEITLQPDFSMMIKLARKMLTRMHKILYEDLAKKDSPSHLGVILKRSMFSNFTHAFSDPNYFSEIRHLIEGVIIGEWCSRYQNESFYYVYRGGSQSLFSFRNSRLAHDQYKPRSYGFSDGLFAGFVYDFESGSTSGYIIPEFKSKDPVPQWFQAIQNKYKKKTNDLSCHVIQIDRRKYRRDLYANFLFIPPVHNIARLNGIGEFHHPRTTYHEEIANLRSPELVSLGGITCYKHFPGIDLGSLVPKTFAKNLDAKEIAFLTSDIPKARHQAYSKKFFQEHARQIKPEDYYPLYEKSCLQKKKPYALDDSQQPIFLSLFPAKKIEQKKSKLQEQRYALDDIDKPKSGPLFS